MANHSSTPFDQGLFLVHFNRGREHFDRRDFADAAEELEEARRLRPSDDAVLNLLGLAYFKQEKFREADAVYRRLLELNPESPTLTFNLGLVCFKLGDLDRAESSFLRTLELKPENQKTHFYLGNIYEKKKQYYNAIFQYRKAGANIMVKRVQDKIDRDRPSERTRGEDFSVGTPAPDDAATRVRAGSDDKARASSNLELDQINVDHIDRRRILTALSEGFSSERKRTPDTAEHVQSRLEKPKPSDTQESILTPEEVFESEDESAEETLPPPARPIADTSTTRLHLKEVAVQDQSLAEIARQKTPGDPSSDLFSPSPDRRRPPPPAVAPLEPVEIPGHTDRGSPMRLSWGATSSEPSLYARTRRRDDIFRYLENNLLEVNFSGKVFIKQGTIYSYSGNLTFWVKPAGDDAAPPLVIVSGTGKLLLTDRQRDISVMQIEGEEIFVEPSHLLACQDTLTPRYGVIEKEGSKRGGLPVLMIQGTGMIALSVATSPLLLTVQEQYPVNVSSSSLITWSGSLVPTIVEDEALAELMLGGPGRGVTLRLTGDGKVMMEKSAT